MLILEMIITATIIMTDNDNKQTNNGHFKENRERKCDFRPKVKIIGSIFAFHIKNRLTLTLINFVFMNMEFNSSTPYLHTLLMNYLIQKFLSQAHSESQGCPYLIV